VVDAAERIIAELRAPLHIAGRAVVVTPSLGIALSQASDERPADLLRHADIAMYRAKAAGKDRFIIFEPGMHAQALRRLEQEHDLRRAIAHDELVLHYQPKVELADGAIHDVEALVRWQHPRLGLVQPSDFIPLAEETGLIVPLGLWVLRAACRQARAWNAARASDNAVMVSVNLSARQFREPTLVADVAGVLAETGLAPELLRLEITESAAMDDADATITTLHALRALGVWLSIDDFGAGYSSLAYLQRYPVDALKIDRAFISALEADGEQEAGGEAIVAAIVGLAHALGIRVVAEGLETAHQLARLRALGCDRAQGFYFAPPGPVDELSLDAHVVCAPGHR
jgi:EAL domain-containing protein (putative c-di-GMP-specific phosphodiesterase class I)